MSLGRIHDHSAEPRAATCRFARVILTGIAVLALVITARAEPMPADLARKLDAIFTASRAPAMVAVILDGERTYIMGAAREGVPPNGRTLLRINSLTKAMTGEILANLIAEGRVRLDDPLSAQAPPGRRVPHAKGGRAITLRDLAAHLSALPRDMPPGLSREGRWRWLATVQPARPPGRVAQYSNAAYMFLGDALSAAANKSFDALLAHYVTGPLALADTTLVPTAEQCSRLLPTERSDFPCAPNAAIGAMGGVYSTADDMARWMRAQLSPEPGSPRARAQKPLVKRAVLRRVVNLDMAGKADAIAMGWLRMRLGALPVIQKTGGGGGFMNYVLLAPTAKKALFITVARVDIEMLRRLTNDANALMAAFALVPHTNAGGVDQSSRARSESGLQP